MAHPFSVATAETLAGTRTITEAELLNTTVFTFDPGGAGRNVDLPAAAAAYAGQIAVILNTADGSEVITIRNGSGGATICTPAQNESAFVFCNGTVWRGLVGASS